MRTTNDPKFRTVGARLNERDYHLLTEFVKLNGGTAADFIRTAIRTLCSATEPAQTVNLPGDADGYN